MKPGLFIVLEGVDRCGKNTQADWLRDHLGGDEHCLRLDFPCYENETGQLIKAIHEAQKRDGKWREYLPYLYAANRKEAQDRIYEALEKGQHVVTCRYTASGIVYAMAHGAKDLNWHMLLQQDVVEPDVEVLLDVPVEVAATRNHYGDDVNEELSLQRKVHRFYTTVQVFSRGHMKVVRGDRPPEEVRAEICELVDREISVQPEI